ncbi:XkdX family protein [Anaerophilus nitritogenes]|nr:XkdX family protein [Anaerophilus nitritogenes]
MNFDIIKKNYDRGLWNNTMVKMAVVKGVITKEEFKTITGEDYIA